MQEGKKEGRRRLKSRASLLVKPSRATSAPR